MILFIFHSFPLSLSLSLSLSLQLQIMAVERCFVPKGKRDTRPNGGLGIDSRLLDCVCCCYPFGHDELRNTSHLLSLSSRSTSALALPQQECRRLFLKGKKRKSSSSFSSARTFLLFISSSSSSHAVHRFLHLLMIGIDVLTRGGCIMFFFFKRGIIVGSDCGRRRCCYTRCHIARLLFRLGMKRREGKGE